MKKGMLWLLAAALLLGMLPAAAEEESQWASVAVFSETEGVTLRKEAGERAEAMALVYGGTPVEILDTAADGEGNEWALVRVGYADTPDVKGYVPFGDLMLFNRNYGAPSLFRSAGVKGPALREEMDESAQGIRAYDRLRLLADMGGGWRLACEDEDLSIAGYIREEELDRLRMEIMAFMRPADDGDRVTVYGDKALREPIGFFYAGVMTQVTDYSQAEGWARAEGFGVYGDMSWDMNWDLTGYVAPQDLLVFTQPWNVDYGTPTGILLDRAENEYGHQLPVGSAVTVIGEMDGKVQIVSAVYDWLDQVDATFAVDPANVEITDRPADRRGPARLGYAAWPTVDAEGRSLVLCTRNEPGGDETGEVEASLLEVVGEKDGWYQLRCYEWRDFWADSEGASFISNDDLIPKRTVSAENPAWTADENDQGLWYLRVEAGSAAELALTRPDGTAESYAAQEADRTQCFTVYLTPGTKVEMQGEGRMIPVNGKDAPILVSDEKQDVSEDEILFSGSGRYFCDTQIAIQNLGIYSFVITPCDEKEESWYAVSTLFDSGEKTMLSYPQDGKWPDEDPLAWWEQEGAFIDLYPGQFLELHNCVMRVFYGNG